MSQDLKSTATDYLRHLERGEWAQARALCTGTATSWRSGDASEVGIEQEIEELRAGTASVRYEITRQLAGPDGLMQQQVEHVTGRDGSRGRVHAAVYFRFEGGLIDRLESYREFVPE